MEGHVIHKIMSSKGPRIDPCGTPTVSSTSLEKQLSILTRMELPER